MAHRFLIQMYIYALLVSPVHSTLTAAYHEILALIDLAQQCTGLYTESSKPIQTSTFTITTPHLNSALAIINTCYADIRMLDDDAVNGPLETLVKKRQVSKEDVIKEYIKYLRATPTTGQQTALKVGTDNSKTATPSINNQELWDEAGQQAITEWKQAITTLHKKIEQWQQDMLSIDTADLEKLENIVTALSKTNADQLKKILDTHKEIKTVDDLMQYILDRKPLPKNIISIEKFIKANNLLGKKILLTAQLINDALAHGYFSILQEKQLKKIQDLLSKTFAYAQTQAAGTTTHKSKSTPATSYNTLKSPRVALGIVMEATPSKKPVSMADYRAIRLEEILIITPEGAIQLDPNNSKNLAPFNLSPEDRNNLENIITKIIPKDYIDMVLQLFINSTTELITYLNQEAENVQKFIQTYTIASPITDENTLRDIIFTKVLGSPQFPIKLYLINKDNDVEEVTAKNFNQLSETYSKDNRFTAIIKQYNDTINQLWQKIEAVQKPKAQTALTQPAGTDTYDSSEFYRNASITAIASNDTSDKPESFEIYKEIMLDGISIITPQGTIELDLAKSKNLDQFKLSPADKAALSRIITKTIPEFYFDMVLLQFIRSTEALIAHLHQGAKNVQNFMKTHTIASPITDENTLRDIIFTKVLGSQQFPIKLYLIDQNNTDVEEVKTDNFDQLSQKYTSDQRFQKIMNEFKTSINELLQAIQATSKPS